MLYSAFCVHLVCNVSYMIDWKKENALMDARFVVGIGNIYASEALWRAQINPKTAVCRISRRRWGKLVWAVQDVLGRAVSDGGTTLNDFYGASGDPGYFQTRLRAYGQRGEPCHRCGSLIRRLSQAGRATYYCASCQHWETHKMWCCRRISA